MSNEFGLTETGFLTPRGDEILETMQQEYADNDQIDETPDFGRDTIQGNLLAIQSVQLAQVWDAAQQIFDALDPNNANGNTLDAVCALVGVIRLEATRSSVTLSLTGTASTIVPAGKQVRSQAGDVFALIEDVTLPGTGVAEAIQTGNIAAPASTIDTIITPVAGWTGVTNLADATRGRDRETDAALRVRRQQALQVGTSRTRGGLKAAVENVAEVDVVLVVENDQPSPQTVQGVALPANAYQVIVFPDVISTAGQQAIGQAIYDFGSAGIQTFGSQSVQVVGLDNQTKTVNFEFATAVGVAVVITFSLETEATITIAEAQAQIQDNITSYFSTLSVGDDVRVLGVLGAISDVQDVAGASVIMNGAALDVSITAVQFATLTSVGFL